MVICWEHDHIPRIAQALVDSYFAPGAPTIPPVPQASSSWPANDYDTIWTFSLDGSGNLTLHNHFFEGISTESLPATP